MIEDWESIILIDAKYLWNNICNIFGKILFVFISRHTDLRYLYLRHNVLHVKNYFQYLFLTNKVCIGFWPETFWSKRDAFLLFHCEHFKLKLTEGLAALVCVATLCRWTTRGLNHSVGGYWALNVPINGAPFLRVLRRNSLESRPIFSEKIPEKPWEKRRKRCCVS